MTTEYTGGNVSVTIGQRASVKLPPRTLRARLTGMLFESAKTFLLPRAMKGIRQLVRFYHDHPGVNVLVNGHTDTQGPADYNRGLSMERADAIAHYLVDASDEWLKWYDGKACSDRWGVREDQYMLAAVRPSKSKPPYYDPERINGALDERTRAAIKLFQQDNTLTDSGTPDKPTRTRLIKAYMALDGTTLPGAPPPLKRHGCGLFHLEVPTGGNVDEPRNRRVEIFLFEGEIKPAPTSLCRWGGCAEYPLWKASAKETIDLDLEPGHITVTVVDEKGKAAADVELEVSGESSDSGKSDGDGHAEFADLPPGQYTVVAKKKGYLPASVDVVVKPEIDAHADLALSRSELRVFEEGGDPEAAKDDLAAPDGAALTLRWRIHGAWKKVELRNVAIDKTVDLAHYTTEQGEVDIGYAPLVLRPELGNQSTGDGGYRAELELTVTRPDDSKDKPRRAVVRVTPASAASGARFVNYVAAEIENAADLGLMRRRRIG